MNTLPRALKQTIVIITDIIFACATVWLAYYLRLGELPSFSWPPIFASMVAVTLTFPIFFAAGLYRVIFRYLGWSALISVFKANSLYGILFFLVFTVYGISGVPRTIGIIQPILLLFFVVASRALAKLLLEGRYRDPFKLDFRPRVLIYGAGTSGRQLADALESSNEMMVVGFLDDDERLHGHVLNGLPIFNPSDLSILRETHAITDILLAMPSVSRQKRNIILARMKDAQVSVRTLPSVTDLAQGKVMVSDVLELDIDDLLGRESVIPNQILLSKNITKKIVLVTGAGGSIGSELCRQALSLRPRKLLMVEQSEFALYGIHQELEGKSQNTELIPLLADVKDEHRLSDILSSWRPQTVYHSAAYKHVPIVEHNLAEGVKNNVFGTVKIAKAALLYDVENFVLISTDKAVRPTNIMGASKRLSEIVLQALAAETPRVNFSMVRFGNVLDSSGSVVPKFRKQIKSGGPVTITHPDITRFFMTIPEAAQLVIQAGAMAKGGDVFVLDMGEPVKILELARRMIELSGLRIMNEDNPDGDVEIKIIGLRPGREAL